MPARLLSQCLNLLYAPNMRFLFVLISVSIAVQPAVAESKLTIHQAFPRAHGLIGHVSIYLPDGYAKASDKHYPTLILLHGLGGSDHDWVSYGNIRQVLDQAISKGVIEPLIAVIPNGDNGYWSDWPDGRIERKFASLVLKDLISWVDKSFRCDGRRAIAGVSMGGFGALSLALQEPSLFQAAGSLSGALFESLPSNMKVYRRAFGTDRQAALRFKKINPVDLIRAGRAKKLAIWLDCGRKDAAKFVFGLSMTAQALVNQGLQFQMRFRDGSHTWEVWRQAFGEMLPWLAKQLAAVR